MERAPLCIIVSVTVDRPLGSVHPNHPSILYELNYGYVAGVMGGDGEAQDAYIMGVNAPICSFEGEVIAIIYRADDTETKWVVAPRGARFTKAEIERAVRFQEKYFTTRIVMARGE